MSTLPSSSLTSYDFLKTLALVTMLIDHLGAFFFFDELWLRVIGRMSAPIWLFLVGYARTRDVPKGLLAGAVIVSLSGYLVSGGDVRLNILWSIIFIRLSLDYIMVWALEPLPQDRSRLRLWLLGALFALASIFVNKFFEYGTIGFLLAIFGYCVRASQRKDGCADKQFVSLAFLISFNVYFFWTCLHFGFWSAYALTLALIGLFVFSLLLNFRAQSFPLLSFGRGVDGFLRLCGRHSLVIYVVHYIAFQWVSLILKSLGGHNI